MQTSTAQRGQRGITVVESAICVAIVSILAGSALPSLRGLQARTEVESAAALFETDLQFARSESVARGQNVRLTLEHGGGASCYVVHTGAAGSCTCLGGETPVCTGEARALRSARYTARGLSVSANVPSMQVEPTAGMVTPTGTVAFQAAGGPSLRQVVNVMGRVRTCAPAGGFPGVRAC